MDAFVKIYFPAQSKISNFPHFRTINEYEFVSFLSSVFDEKAIPYFYKCSSKAIQPHILEFISTRGLELDNFISLLLNTYQEINPDLTEKIWVVQTEAEIQSR